MSKTFRIALLGFSLGASCLTQGAARADEDTGDSRVAVVLRPVERVRILGDMRQYLSGIQQIFAALAKDDLATVASTARSLGKVDVYERASLVFPRGMAPQFRELSTSVHKSFDRIADDAEKIKDAKLVQAEMGELMNKCVACHATFQLRDMAHGASVASR